MEREYSGFYKDFLDGNVKVRTINSVFSNSDCLFCEFNDVIAPTWLTIIHNLRVLNPEGIERILDLDPIRNLSGNELLRWYALRNNRNALLDLKRDDVSTQTIDSLTENLLNDKIAYINTQNTIVTLNYASSLTKTINTASKIIKKFVIYVEQCNPVIDEVLMKLYPDKVKFVSGDLVSVFKDIPRDSTYVFSDVTKINALIDADRLNGASVLLTDGYAYNYKDRNIDKIGVDENLIVDLAPLYLKYNFLFNTFNNFTDD